MAAVNGATSQSQNTPPSGPRGENARGGRGRGRGRGSQNQRSNQRDGEGGRNEGSRGQFPRGGGNTSYQSGNVLRTSDLATRFSKTSLTDGSSKSQDSAATAAKPKDSDKAGEDDVEAEVCFICASPVVHNSVAPCNHRTCHICALRMRALYKTKDCAHCRTTAQYVIFTDDPTRRFEDFTPAQIVNTDENIGIKYEKLEILEDTILLLRYNCPDPSCDVACLGWPDLHRHVRSVHHKKMCDLCTRHKKVFAHEHELFTDKELERHMKRGDDNPGAVDQSGFKGHPLCGFCGERFYGDDELYVHCRNKHERCFICDRNGGQPQYYQNYDSLAAHFRKAHFPCPERECVEKKFIVFPSELDLKAHQLEEHGSTLSKDVRRDARTVNLSQFDVRTPYVEERRAGGSQREGRGRGRGRDPNAEPPPGPSTQPLRRDELAYQRQMAIQGAQSSSTRAFGGQLSAPSPPPAAVARGGPPPARDTPTSRPSPTLDTSGGVDINDPNITPQEQARRLRHAGVVERATSLLQNDQLKMNQFRHAISAYRANETSAAALIDTFFALFSDTSSNALGSLVRDIADLYEDKSKAEALRTAWNDWRAINEDYPSLPGPSGINGTSLPAGWAQITASTSSSSNTSSAPKPSRVLKLKSSTAQSSRSSASRSGAWNPPTSSSPSLSSTSTFASHANPTNTPAFPSLPSSSSNTTSSTNRPSWVSNSQSTSSTPRPTPPTSRPASRGTSTRGGPALTSGNDAFPALPPAAKPTTTIFGYGTGMVRRDLGGGSSASNAWGAGGGSSGGTVESPVDESGGGGAGGATGGKKKGNKGKKQVLVQWG